MQINSTPNTTRGRRAENILLGLGVFFILCNCIYMSHVVALDLFGSKTIGELTVRSYPCTTNRGERTCQTAGVEYVAENGGTLWFDAGFFPIVWDIISPPEDDSSSQTWDVEVRYFSAFPWVAKMKLPFHLEYLNPGYKKSIWGSLKI